MLSSLPGETLRCVSTLVKQNSKEIHKWLMGEIVYKQLQRGEGVGICPYKGEANKGKVSTEDKS